MRAQYCNHCGRPLGPGDPRCSICAAPVDTRLEQHPTASLLAVDVELPRIPPDDLGRLVADARVTGVLVVTKGPIVGSRYNLAAATTRLGRATTSDVVLDDVSVSRRHAEIHRLGLAYALADSGSFNGTYLNGERVDEMILGDLDELRLGRFELIFLAPT